MDLDRLALVTRGPILGKWPLAALHVEFRHVGEVRHLSMAEQSLARFQAPGCHCRRSHTQAVSGKEGTDIHSSGEVAEAGDVGLSRHRTSLNLQDPQRGRKRGALVHGFHQYFDLDSDFGRGQWEIQFLLEGEGEIDHRVRADDPALPVDAATSGGNGLGESHGVFTKQSVQVFGGWVKSQDRVGVLFLERIGVLHDAFADLIVLVDHPTGMARHARHAIDDRPICLLGIADDGRRSLVDAMALSIDEHVPLEAVGKGKDDFAAIV